MILAAGRGERMRPLTDNCPKPLLELQGKPLIQWHVERLHAAGVRDLVINTAWLGQQVRDYLGDGSRFGVTIAFSDEGDRALETGGGINKALPLLGTEPFWLVNGDVYCDFDFAPLSLADDQLAHLLLVPNPEHNPDGDFPFAAGRVLPDDSDAARYTFAGISLLRPELIAGDDVFPLAPLLRSAAAAGKVSAQLHDGLWVDIGTPERLKQAATLIAN